MEIQLPRGLCVCVCVCVIINCNSCNDYIIFKDR